MHFMDFNFVGTLILDKKKIRYEGVRFKFTQTNVTITFIAVNADDCYNNQLKPIITFI